MKDFHFRTTCRLCDGSTTLAIDYGSTPLANELVTREFVKSGAKQDIFPLQIVVCNRCGHVQLSGVVSPERLFAPNYPYRSGASPIFRKHLDAYAKELVDRFGKPHLTIEIGGNDGTMIRALRDAGAGWLINVDPVGRVDVVGSSVKPRLFTSALAREMRDTIDVSPDGRAGLIVANHVFAHINDLKDVVEGVKILLADEGVFVFEVGYLGDVLAKGLFDVVYHEHLSYHHVRPLVEFFRRMGMTLFDAEHVDTQGGSIRCFVKHGVTDEKPRMLERYAVERFSSELAVRPALANLQKQTESIAHDVGVAFRPVLQGKRIAAYGAPAKACTFLHLLGVRPGTIEFIVDDNPVKHGLFTPSAPDGPGHIEIRPVEALAEAKPDYVLVLAWNFAEDIIRRYPGYRYIVPLPKLRLVES